jgi:hypothetical protein
MVSSGIDSFCASAMMRARQMRGGRPRRAFSAAFAAAGFEVLDGFDKACSPRLFLFVAGA